MSKVVIVIPARFGSQRLPGKPLLNLAGKPLLAHTIDRAKAFAATIPDAQVLVATDDERIASLAGEQQVDVLMTKAEHPTGTDRLAECARTLKWSDDTIVVNLQGDEPLMPISALKTVVDDLKKHHRASVSTLATPIESIEQLFDPACVKVVLRADHRALYFSRAPMPWPRDAFQNDRNKLPANVPFLRHLGLYAYRAGALKQLADLPQSSLEKTESLEQLRALEAGLDITVGMATESIPQGVDTPEDLKRLDSMMTLQSVGTLSFKSATKTKLHADKIAFVCMGNICRSPLSMAYAQKRAQELGFPNLGIASRGTHARKGANAPADLRTQAIARSVQIDLRTHRAAPLIEQDFYEFDLLIAHDERNLADMQAICPPGMESKVRLLMSFAENAPRVDVPDPYMGDHDDFILAWQLCKLGVDGLFGELIP